MEGNIMSKDTDEIFAQQQNNSWQEKCSMWNGGEF